MPDSETDSTANVHKLLLKAIFLLEEIADQSSKLTVKSLARHLNLSYPSTYRIVQTFLYADWLRLSESGILEISPSLHMKLDKEKKQQRLVAQLKPLIDQLCTDSQLTVKLSVRSENEAISLYRATSPRPTGIASQLGARYHLAAGSSGATLLSGLPKNEIESILKTAPDYYWQHQKKKHVLDRIAQVQENGYCLDAGQFYPDLRTISIPVRDISVRVLAAFTLMGFPSDFSEENWPGLRKLIQEIAPKIKEALLRDPIPFSEEYITIVS
jgi:DNA-binding IclR family transcriptional regulator